MLQYKANLGLLNSRYTEIERQLLRALTRNRALRDDRGEWRTDIPNPIGTLVTYGAVYIPFGMLWTVASLIDDELVTVEGLHTETLTLHLTAAGEELVSRWMDAEPLD